MEWTLFIDLDDTLLDFQTSQNLAFQDLCQKLGIDYSQQVFEDFKTYNHGLWQSLEKGDLSKDALLANRFPDFFKRLGLNINPAWDMDQYFREGLSRHPILVDGAKDLLETLSNQAYRLVVASNGVEQTQIDRLAASKISHYFDHLFISERLGYEKPHPEFFLQAFSQLTDLHLNKCLMIGDSLSSDMKGAMGIGMKKIWFNPHGLTFEPQDFIIDYQVKSLDEIPALLQTITKS